jgi:hypothetical protein
MILFVLNFENDKMMKTMSKYDEQDENNGIFAKNLIILSRLKKFFSIFFLRFDRDKCLLSNGDFHFFQIVQTRRQFCQKAKDLVNKMAKKRNNTKQATMYCNLASSSMFSAGYYWCSPRIISRQTSTIYLDTELYKHRYRVFILIEIN